MRVEFASWIYACASSSACAYASLQPQPFVVDGGLLFALNESDFDICHQPLSARPIFDFNFTVINRGNIPVEVNALRD